MKKRILGIDTGTNSLGWAVVERDETNNQYELIDKGSNIFQEGEKVVLGKNELSKAAERTKFRGIRRLYFRRRLRKIEVLKVLVEYNLCPHLSDEELHLWRFKKQYPMNDDFLLWQRTNENEEKNPYYYRHLCLHQRLDLSVPSERYILGRALYHLAQRRGFLSNRSEENDNDEIGKIKAGISDLSKEMSKSGFDYLGDYFYHLYSTKGNTVKIRQRYTDREQHYETEFYAICEKQQLEKDLVHKLYDALYFQRPLKSQRMGVGKCTFEPAKPRCSESHPDFEEFRMYTLLNNIKVKTSADHDFRPLTDAEIEKIKPLFYRKKKQNFDFEEIAEKLAGKDNYASKEDRIDKPYVFNYRMSQGVSGCPTIAQLRSIFGENWKEAIAETYQNMQTKHGSKTVEDAVNDVWNVLYSFKSRKKRFGSIEISFDSKEKLFEFAKQKLQLDDKKAKSFSEIKLNRGYASLSLKAIRNILPFLRAGYVYSDAVFYAKIPEIVSYQVWERDYEKIMREVTSILHNRDPKDKQLTETIESVIKDTLRNMYELPAGATEKLYHPSIIDVYPDAKANKDGIFQLGSPRTNAVRNPMAMRSLHQLRKVVNKLLQEKIIDQTTEVHIEYARELNDANRRKAIGDYNKILEKKHKEYAAEISKLYKAATGKDFTPNDDDILKFQLWKEQNGKCLYTGKEIAITDFIGANPKFDIEHTIPQSVGGDSTKMNLTLCDSEFNRYIKKTKLPSELSNHQEIMERISDWLTTINNLSKKIDGKRTYNAQSKEKKDKTIQERHLLKLERDYWKGKYERFTMKEVPEGFSRRQGTGIGLISKYAGFYLKSLFHKPNERNKSNVYVIKGVTTAEFRRLWGIQDLYQKKSRDNHAHHCIDAITIACIGKHEYDQMAHYYRQEEEYKNHAGAKPSFPKPWATFVEDIKKLENEILIAHAAPPSVFKHSRKRIRTPKGEIVYAQGDTVRSEINRATYYGAIERDGKIKYVQRKKISELEFSDINKIVDDVVREKVRKAFAGKNIKEARMQPIYMNKEKGILIKKVRCYSHYTTTKHISQQRDLSKKEYKRQFHITNTNYLVAVYRGMNAKNVDETKVLMLDMIDAANAFKRSAKEKQSLIPAQSPEGYPLKYCFKKGQLVLLYEKDPKEIKFDDNQNLSKHLYKITSTEANYVILLHHAESRPVSSLEKKKGAYKNGEEFRPLIGIKYQMINALVEGVDFTIDVLGKIKPIKKN